MPKPNNFKLKHLDNTKKSLIVDRCHKALVDFGYSDLTKKEVEEQLQLLIDGKKPTDIIGMFMQRWFD